MILKKMVEHTKSSPVRFNHLYISIEIVIQFNIFYTNYLIGYVYFELAFRVISSILEHVYSEYILVFSVVIEFGVFVLLKPLIGMADLW